MARVGFIGLGKMGRGMAGRLLSHGHELRVFNRTVAKTDPLVREGA
ncbi:MAG: NAD(P)-binding domain-containing protein, partial [Polyangia bacterium]